MKSLRLFRNILTNNQNYLFSKLKNNLAFQNSLKTGNLFGEAKVVQRLNFLESKNRVNQTKSQSPKISSSNLSSSQSKPHNQNTDYQTLNEETLKIIFQPLKMPKNSSAILFMKQHYQKLFYSATSAFPSIRSTSFRFFNSKQISPQYLNQIRVKISILDDNKTQIVVSVYNKSQNGLPTNQKKFSLDYKLLPYLQNNVGTIAAKQLLQKKFWIKLSAQLNYISININDYSTAQQSSQNLSQNTQTRVQLKQQNHQSWKNQQIVYSMNPAKNVERQLSIDDLDSIQIQFQVAKSISFPNLKDYQEALNDSIKIDIMEVQKVFNSVLDQNPSFLTKNANKQLLTQQMRILYEYLRNFSLDNLPATSISGTNFDQSTYKNWRCLKSAIDKSIKTQPAYFCYEDIKDKSTKRQPIGLLNALMQAKSITQSDRINIKNLFKWTQFVWDQGSYYKNLKKIYDNRQMYVRMEMLEHEGVSPGAMAVLEIWPPFCCSSVHNHGQAFGLIKVAANQICVQNYNDLNFLYKDQIPYKSSIYQQGQYTWLSQYSYGIHRLMNKTSQTSLTLQAYMGGKTSKQYFQFIVDPSAPVRISSAQKAYIEYFPQNDWINFMKWPETIDKFEGKDQEIVKHLCQFIKEVRNYYGITDDKLDLSQS